MNKSKERRREDKKVHGGRIPQAETERERGEEK